MNSVRAFSLAEGSAAIGTSPPKIATDGDIRHIVNEFIKSVHSCLELSADKTAADLAAREAAYKAACDRRAGMFKLLCSLHAVERCGLAAKLGALSAAVEWLTYQDPRLGEFAVQLAYEEGDYIARHPFGSNGLSVPRWLGNSIVRTWR